MNKNIMKKYDEKVSVQKFLNSKRKISFDITQPKDFHNENLSENEQTESKNKPESNIKKDCHFEDLEPQIENLSENEQTSVLKPAETKNIPKSKIKKNKNLDELETQIEESTENEEAPVFSRVQSKNEKNNSFDNSNNESELLSPYLQDSRKSKGLLLLFLFNTYLYSPNV